MHKPLLGVYTPILHIPNLYEDLEKNFEIIYHPDSDYENALININKFEYIFTNPNKLKFTFDKTLLQRAIKLKVFATASTGENHVDLEYLRSTGVKFISLKERKDVIKNLTSTAELAFLFLLSYARKFIPAIESVKNKEWDYEKFIGERIQDLSIGVIGYGRLGQLFSHYCKSFGATVGVYDPYRNIDSKFITFKNLNDLFSNCNAISLHVHLNKETEELINSTLLNLTMENCALINTSRGRIVNEPNIIEWLEKSGGHYYFADVLQDENGNIHNSKLLEKSHLLSQTIITPHIGGMTYQGQNIAYRDIAKLLVEELQKN